MLPDDVCLDRRLPEHLKARPLEHSCFPLMPLASVMLIAGCWLGSFLGRLQLGCLSCGCSDAPLNASHLMLLIPLTLVHFNI
jgi:hypothetical protein